MCDNNKQAPYVNNLNSHWYDDYVTLVVIMFIV